MQGLSVCKLTTVALGVALVQHAAGGPVPGTLPEINVLERRSPGLQLPWTKGSGLAAKSGGGLLSNLGFGKTAGVTPVIPKLPKYRNVEAPRLNRQEKAALKAASKGPGIREANIHGHFAEVSGARAKEAGAKAQESLNGYLASGNKSRRRQLFDDIQGYHEVQVHYERLQKQHLGQAQSLRGS